jgi:hypothetical protein
MPPHAVLKSAPLQPQVRRGVIGGDHIDTAVQKLGPERLLIAPRAERRRTLGHGAQSLDVLIGKEQIVRARLDRYIHAASASAAKTTPRPQLDEVQLGADLGAARHAVNREPAALDAPDERHTEAHALFVGESNNFNAEWKAMTIDEIHKCQAQHDAEDSVECAGIWNGVQVRADHEAGRLAGWEGRRGRKGMGFHEP